jgi:hypothetical protein
MIDQGMDARMKKINDDLAETYSKSLASQEANENK